LTRHDLHHLSAIEAAVSEVDIVRRSWRGLKQEKRKRGGGGEALHHSCSPSMDTDGDAYGTSVAHRCDEERGRDRRLSHWNELSLSEREPQENRRNPRDLQASGHIEQPLRGLRKRMAILVQDRVVRMIVSEEERACERHEH